MVGPPCSDGCFDRVTPDGVNSVFSAFWGLGDYDMQNAYLQKLIRVKAVKRKRTTAEISRRATTMEYSIINGLQTIKVCKAGFIAMHGLTRGRIESVVKKMTHTGIPIADRRGKHPSSNKIVGVNAARVREHIRMLPVLTSHYSRATAPHRRYLDSSLSISKLHDLYISWMSEILKKCE